MSRDGIAAKNEVVVSTRRQWPQEQKLAILAEVDAPGSSVSQVARRHGLRSSLLFRWRRDFRKGTGPKPVVPSFVPVRLPPPRATDAQGRSGIIEVVLANGRTVRVGADVDTAVLMRIIDALEMGR
jgi:transposase